MNRREHILRKEISKIKVLTTVICLAALMGCGKSQAVTDSNNTNSEVDTQIEDAQVSEETEEKTEEVQTNDIEEQDEKASEETKVVFDDSMDSSAEESEEDLTENSQSNMGYGYFVESDGTVYYRIPNVSDPSKPMDKTDIAYFSGFLDDDLGVTLIRGYNEKTKEISSFAEHGMGKIALTGGLLYLFNAPEEDNEHQFNFKISYDPSTDTDDYLQTTDEFVGVDDKTGFAVSVENVYDGGDCTGYIHRNKPAEFVMSDSVDNCIVPVGVGEGYFVYYTYENDTGENPLWSYSLDDQTFTKLGNISDLVTDDSIDYYEIDECIISGGKVYFADSCYEGTGHFFYDALFLEAELGKENSLSKSELELTEGKKYETEESHARPFAVIDGVMTASDGIPGTADIVGGDIPELVYYDNDGNKKVVCKDKFYSYEFGDDSKDSIDFSGLEYLNGYIYGYKFWLKRVPEDDIGWREAYKRNKIEVFRVNVDTGVYEVLEEVGK